MSKPVACSLALLKVVGEGFLEEAIVESFVRGFIPGVAAQSKQGGFVGINCFDREDEFLRDLLRTFTLSEGFQYVELARAGLPDDLIAAFALLCIHDCFLRSARIFGAVVGSLGQLREVSPPGNKRPFYEGNAICLRDVHLSTLAHLLLDSVGSVDMPDVILAIKGQEGNGECQQGHQATTAGHGEVNVTMLAFEVSN